MLEEAAPTFAGWKMFLNHLSPEAKKAAAGLPRDIRDTGGIVQEAGGTGRAAERRRRHGQGAVVGMVRPVKFIRELIDDDPALAEASISASATGVRQVTHEGQRCWLVEGINPRGSVDWVTEAGAGGRIVPMLEEAYADRRTTAHRRCSSRCRTTRCASTSSGPPDAASGGQGPRRGTTKTIPPRAATAARTSSRRRPRSSKGRACRARRPRRQRARRSLSQTEEDDMPITKEEPFRRRWPSRRSPRRGRNAERRLPGLPDVAGREQDRAGARHAPRGGEGRRGSGVPARADGAQAHAMIAESRCRSRGRRGSRRSSRCRGQRAGGRALDVNDDVDDDGKVEKPAIDRCARRCRPRSRRSARVCARRAPLESAARRTSRRPRSTESRRKATSRRPRREAVLGADARRGRHPDPEKAYALEG
jgi:hypothetical protein